MCMGWRRRRNHLEENHKENLKNDWCFCLFFSPLLVSFNMLISSDSSTAFFSGDRLLNTLLKHTRTSSRVKWDWENSPHIGYTSSPRKHTQFPLARAVRSCTRNESEEKRKKFQWKRRNQLKIINYLALVLNQECVSFFSSSEPRFSCLLPLFCHCWVLGSFLTHPLLLRSTHHRSSLVAGLLCNIFFFDLRIQFLCRLCFSPYLTFIASRRKKMFCVPRHRIIYKWNNWFKFQSYVHFRSWHSTFFCASTTSLGWATNHTQDTKRERGDHFSAVAQFDFIYDTFSVRSLGQF